MSNITNGAALLFTILGAPDQLGRAFDLTKLRPKHIEIERKYHLPPDEHRDGGALRFKRGLSEFLDTRHAIIERTDPFVGIDEYCNIIGVHGDRASIRYRVGVNKLPELAVKFQLVEGSNERRGEINLDVRNESPESVRAFISLISRMVQSAQMFCIRQSGELFVINDPQLGTIEVVCYHVAGIQPLKPSRPFAELEPKGWETPEQAAAALDCYEQGLGLTRLRCNESISELFAP